MKDAQETQWGHMVFVISKAGTAGHPNSKIMMIMIIT